MDHRLLSLLILPALLMGNGAVDAANSDPQITRAEIEAHVNYLASDELRGRETGSPESRLASEYLARAFKAAGLEPAGDDGTFFQSVPMERIEYTGQPELHFLAASGDTSVAKWGVDFDLAGGDLHSTATLIISQVSEAGALPAEAAPERAFFLDGKRSDVRAWVGDLKAPGRCGLIMEIGRSKLGSVKQRNPRSPRNPQVVATPKAPRVRLRGEWIDRAKAGEFLSVRLVQSMTSESVAERNVVAKITGVGTKADPAMAKETLVYSAHFDHIGVTDRPEAPPAGEEPDTIRNGADDDASGVAAVLELAQAYAAGEPPARTLLFLLVTGEEIGLVGTEYYLDHPVIPLADTVCNLNFEMIGRPDELIGGAGKLWLSGYEYSTLANAIEESGVPIAPDARPNEQFFKRSDNYAFVKRGIVAQTLSSYNMHQDYHQTSDEADTLDYGHMETCVRSAYMGFESLVNGRLRPEWREGIDPKEL